MSYSSPEEPRGGELPTVGGGGQDIQGTLLPVDLYWEQIVTVHNHVKAVVLRAEGEDPQNRADLRAAQEQRHALEHIVRARGVETGAVSIRDVMPNLVPELTREQVEAKRDAYCARNYDKALSHELRAFFDAADLLSMTVTEKITRIMDRFSPSVTSTVFSEYHESLFERLAELSGAIARTRGDKDAGKADPEREIAGYLEILEELLAIEKKVVGRVPLLVKARRARRFSIFIWPIVLVVASALMGAWVAAWWQQKPTTPTQEPRPPATAPLPTGDDGADPGGADG